MEILKQNCCYKGFASRSVGDIKIHKTELRELPPKYPKDE